jgi:hypothetical protein
MLIEEKCRLHEKVSLAQKQHDGLVSSVKEAQTSEAIYENLERCERREMF